MPCLTRRESPSLHLRIPERLAVAAAAIRSATHADAAPISAPSSSTTTKQQLLRASSICQRRRVTVLLVFSIMSDMKDTNAAGHETVGNPEPMDQTQDNSMPSAQEQEQAIKKKFGGLMPKKPPLISKDHERAYFDSADWALGKSGQQGVAKPKGPLEALRPKLQPTRQQQQRSRRLINTSSENEDGDGAGAEDMNIN
ncbi:hypothetical protein GUJ93_ZPchr0008g11497 [Zizania palustris]|uniref:Negatively light-regulated protein n=1 Tax=Zizania palustris TaxID=103762 RepID=A0A8J5QX16_ZIZPA|nr:hypothetical protein GUJ93_ZPchr0008g11497 [Zizania palustris]